MGQSISSAVDKIIEGESLKFEEGNVPDQSPDAAAGAMVPA